MGGLAQNVQKPPPGKNVQKIPRSNISGICGMSGISGMPRSNFPRSNGKIKNVQKSQGQIFQEFVECVECQECVECVECEN